MSVEKALCCLVQLPNQHSDFYSGPKETHTGRRGVCLDSAVMPSHGQPRSFIQQIVPEAFCTWRLGYSSKQTEAGEA